MFPCEFFAREENANCQHFALCFPILPARFRIAILTPAASSTSDRLWRWRIVHIPIQIYTQDMPYLSVYMYEYIYLE